MRLVQIVRYPVKSLQGEVVAAADIVPTGLAGDRCWGIRDEATRKILTARRAPELLYAAATLTADGTPRITLPGGAVLDGPGLDTDAALTEWLGRPVRLVTSLGLPGAEAEFFEDATDDSSPAVGWTMPAGRFVDAKPLLLLTTASLRTAAALHPDGDWHPRRFRANLLLDLDTDLDGDGWPEDAWCEHSVVRTGEVVMQPREGCVRCTMVTRPQPDLTEDRDIFRTLARHHGARFGVWTDVVLGGTVRAGDDVQVEPAGAPQAPLIVAQRPGDEPVVRPLDPA